MCAGKDICIRLTHHVSPSPPEADARQPRLYKSLPASIPSHLFKYPCLLITVTNLVPLALQPRRHRRRSTPSCGWGSAARGLNQCYYQVCVRVHARAIACRDAGQEPGGRLRKLHKPSPHRSLSLQHDTSTSGHHD
jgi:hypothetical protein